MGLFSSLPRTLLALSLISLVTLPDLGVTVSLPPTSFNDPFRAITVIHRTQQPEPPLCCLKPLPTIDSPEGPEGALLSFEEWKSRQLGAGSPNVPRNYKVDTPDGDTLSKHSVQRTDVPLMDAQLPYDLSYPTPDDILPPHFRVPIIDRFNYANMDCSARVHMVHKSAKSASSILSSKKDKYMLSPCSADVQFVVVELCDDIRIDTVQLANFEFFSGVFMDFSVSVAKTYTGTDEGWTPAGTYRAKNIRGVQSFHPPTSLRDFYRFIRIDFHSHYGHEYYCPVSLLRVYGLTHLEEWKWDVWLAESRGRLRDSAAQRSLLGETPVASDATHPQVVSSSVTNVSTTRHGATDTRSHVTSQTPPVQVTSTPTRDASSLHGSPSMLSDSRGRSSAQALGEGTLVSSNSGNGQALATQFTGAQSVTEAISSLLSITSPASVVLSTTLAAEHPHLQSHDSEVHALTAPLSQPSNPSAPTLTQQAPTHAPSPQQWSGESIYRTIMNRLTILEANHTLYARYVEEQTARMREVLRKLNEEVGRLESISQMQAQMYQRTVHEWERQRLRLELEHGELLSRVNHLSDEVVLEKRLGIAQLCLLLAVLVFIGLTRGAPAQHPLPTAHRSTREAGARNLSFGSSADGWNLFRGQSRSSTGQSGSMKAEKATGVYHPLIQDDVTPMVAAVDNPPLLSGPLGCSGSQPELLPTAQSFPLGSRTFKSPVVPTGASSHRRAHTASALRTPTKPRSLALADARMVPGTEPIVRSHSSSMSGQPHARSAKRWARTAHLHEIKVSHERRGSGTGKRSAAYRERENVRVDELGDVFHFPSSLSPAGAKSSKRQGMFERLRTPLGVVRDSQESADADAWIDTDDDLSVVGGPVVLNSADGDVFGLG